MHGNWDAFAAVLRRVKRKKFDATLVLGDLVPAEVIDAQADPPVSLRLGDGLINISDVVAALRISVLLARIVDAPE